MAITRITLPATARRGETVEVQWLIAHPMETGHRSDDQGRVVAEGPPATSRALPEWRAVSL